MRIWVDGEAYGDEDLEEADYDEDEEGAGGEGGDDDDEEEGEGEEDEDAEEDEEQQEDGGLHGEGGAAGGVAAGAAGTASGAAAAADAAAAAAALASGEAFRPVEGLHYFYQARGAGAVPWLSDNGSGDAIAVRYRAATISNSDDMEQRRLAPGDVRRPALGAV